MRLVSSNQKVMLSVFRTDLQQIKKVIVDAGDKVKDQILFVLDPEQDAGGLKRKH